MNEARQNCCFVVLNDFLYAVGGFGKNSKLSSAERYDPKSDSWSSLSPMNSARAFASAIAFKGKIFVCGGEDNQGESLNFVEVYDPVKDEWRTVCQMKESRCTAGLCVYMDELWVFGAKGNMDELPLHFSGLDATLSVEKYNPETDTWSDGPEMLKSKKWGVAGVLSATL